MTSILWTYNKCTKTCKNIVGATQKNTNKKWTKFMHFGEDIRILTKLLESANIKAAYRVKNTTEDYSINRQKYKYNYSGNFKLECHNCEQVYAGQTGRDFRFRFKEQIYGTLDTIMKSHSMPNIFLNVNIGSVQK
jgi:hypothetical protein